MSIDDKFHASQLQAIYITLLTLLIMAILLFRVNDYLHISLLLLSIGILHVYIAPLKQWTHIDIILCIITIYELVSCCWAECLAPTVSTMCYSVFNLVIYFFMRHILAIRTSFFLFSRGSYFFIGIALLLAIGNFYIFYNSVLDTGFIDVYHFRFMNRPLGYALNVWTEILLIFLGWGYLIKWHFTLYMYLCIQLLLLSFSRGAYVSLSIYLICILCILKSKCEILRLMIVTFVSIILTAYFFPHEMKTTLQMNIVVSQQESIQGRINATQAAWSAFHKRPLLGYGNNNFTYAIDHTINQDSTCSYTWFAPNIIMQILVEKGLLGVIIYGLLVLAIFYQIWRYRKRNEVCIIGVIIFVLLIKEMTQATLFTTPFSFCMFYILLAFLNEDKKKINFSRQPLNYIFLSVGIICFIFWNTPISQFLDPTPKRVNKALEEMRNYELDTHIEHLYQAEDNLKKCLIKHPDDLHIHYLQARVYQAKGEIKKAESLLKGLIELCPRNSLFLFNLSELQYVLEKRDSALYTLVAAISYDPRLLTNKHIKMLKNIDNPFYSEILNELSKRTPLLNSTPSDYARYGYLAYYCGFPDSCKYLQMAVDMLPNLVTPWFLLGDEQKYQLLLYGIFYKRNAIKNEEQGAEITDEIMFGNIYSNKFRKWYDCELTSKQRLLFPNQIED